MAAPLQPLAFEWRVHSSQVLWGLATVAPRAARPWTRRPCSCSRECPKSARSGAPLFEQAHAGIHTVFFWCCKRDEFDTSKAANAVRPLPKGSLEDRWLGGKKSQKSSLSEVQARGLLWQSGVRGANDAGLLVKPLLPDLELASRALCAPVKLLQKDVLRVEAVKLLGVRLRDDSEMTIWGYYRRM